MSETQNVEEENNTIEMDFNLNLYAPGTNPEEMLKNNEKIAIFFLNTYSILIDMNEDAAVDLLTATHPYIVFLANVVASRIVEDTSLATDSNNDKLEDLKNRIQPNLLGKLKELFGEAVQD